MTDEAKRQDRDEVELALDDTTTRAACAEDTQGIQADADQPSPQTERPRSRRAPRKPPTKIVPVAQRADDSEAPVATETEQAVEAVEAAPQFTALETDLSELEAKGFTTDEALRLIDISRRLESSAEALESAAELKRLRFAQWLIERGILDEFGA